MSKNVNEPLNESGKWLYKWTCDHVHGACFNVEPIPSYMKSNVWCVKWLIDHCLCVLFVTEVTKCCMQVYFFSALFDFFSLSSQPHYAIPTRSTNYILLHTGSGVAPSGKTVHESTVTLGWSGLYTFFSNQLAHLILRIFGRRTRCKHQKCKFLKSADSPAYICVSKIA